MKEGEGFGLKDMEARRRRGNEETDWCPKELDLHFSP